MCCSVSLLCNNLSPVRGVMIDHLISELKYIRTELTYVYCPKNDWKPRLFGRKDSLQKPRCHFPTLETKYHDLLTEVLVCRTSNNIKLKSPTMAVRYPPLAKISGRRGTVALRPLGWKNKSLHRMVQLTSIIFKVDSSLFDTGRGAADLTKCYRTTYISKKKLS